MAVLSAQEFQQIHCGSTFDQEKRVITPKQHKQLELACEGHERKFGFSFLDRGPRQSLVAKQYVGVVAFGRDQLEILPKIDADSPQVRGNLCSMIAACLDLDLHAPGQGHMDSTADSVLEVLVGLFCREMWHMVRRGLVRGYVRRSETLPYLKGRLSVPIQIRANLSRPDRLACEFEEFTEDNALNRLLKAALRVLLPVVRSANNQRSLSELLFCFQDVADIPVAQMSMADVSVTRLTKHLEPLVSLAKLFLRSSSQDVVTGEARGFTLLFDMNELFEGYIGNVMRKVCAKGSTRVTLQGPSRFLAKRATGGNAFLLRPDIVGQQAGDVAFIADTKWKRLKPQDFREGVASADVYQMYAYATRYEAADVVLLYPHHGLLGPWQARRAQYVIETAPTAAAATERKISVATVDLRDLAQVPAQLTATFSAHLH